MELEGKIVRVRPELLKEGLDNRFLCEGGFGCNSFTNGTKIFGKWVADGTEDQIGGYDLTADPPEEKK